MRGGTMMYQNLYAEAELKATPDKVWEKVLDLLSNLPKYPIQGKWNCPKWQARHTYVMYKIKQHKHAKDYCNEWQRDYSAAHAYNNHLVQLTQQ